MNARNIVRRTGLGLTALMALAISMGSVKAQDGQGQPPDPNRPPVGFGRGDNPPPPPRPRPDGFPVIPPPVADALNLTDKQKTELKALEKEVNEKIKKILTADQMKKLKSLRDRNRPPMGRNGMRPPPPGGFGGPGGGPPPPGGFGGPGGGPPPPDGGQGGRGGQGAPPPPPGDRDQAHNAQAAQKKA